MVHKIIEHFLQWFISNSSSFISAVDLSNINISRDVTDPISDEISMAGLIPLMATAPMLYQNIVDDSLIYAYVLSVYAKKSIQVTPEWLSKVLHIGI